MTDEKTLNCIERFLFPEPIYNRAGLSKIRYRIGSYEGFRRSMLRALKNKDALQQWTYRGSDDPGIALIESSAVLSDILTFYQDLYANEAFLGTAQWPESVRDLVRLTGYMPTPGLGGSGTVSVQLRGKNAVQVPEGLPLKVTLESQGQPAEFETKERLTADPRFGKFRLYGYFSFVFQGKVRSFSCDPADAARLQLKKGDRLAAIAAHQLPIYKILTVVEVTEKLNRKVIKTIETWEDPYPADFFYSPSVQLFKLGRSFRHFGYNSATQYPNPSGNTVNFQSTPFFRAIRTRSANVPDTSYEDLLQKVNDATQAAQNQADPQIQEGALNGLSLDSAYLALALNNQQCSVDSQNGIEPQLQITQDIWQLPLQGEIKGLLPGDAFVQITPVLSTQTGAAPLDFYVKTTIQQIEPMSMQWGTVVGPATFVTVPAADFQPLDSKDIRGILVHEVLGNFYANPWPEPYAPLDTAHLQYFGDEGDFQPLDGMPVILSDGQDKFHSTTLRRPANWYSDNPGSYTLTLDPPPPAGTFFDSQFGFEDQGVPPVSAYGNLVAITQGKTYPQTAIGDGDDQQAFQTFKIPKGPLTYLRNPAVDLERGQAELTVWVNDRKWTEVPSFFHSGPGDEVYIVRQDSGGDSWIQFGDGNTGRRLPKGSRNVSIRWRTGVGAFGPQKKGTLVQAGKSIPGIDKILLMGPIQDGAAPEPSDKTRRVAPGKLQSLDRIVSLQDFETVLLAMPGVVKCSVEWDLLKSGEPGIRAVALMDSRRQSDFTGIQQGLVQADWASGSANHSISVEQGKFAYVTVVPRVYTDGKVDTDALKLAIKSALGAWGEDELPGILEGDGLFALRKRSFGQAEYANRVLGAIQNVSGVVSVDLIRFDLAQKIDPNSDSDQPTDFIWPPQASEVLPSVPCESGQILTLHTDFFNVLFDDQEIQGAGNV